MRARQRQDWGNWNK